MQGRARPRSGSSPCWPAPAWWSPPAVILIKPSSKGSDTTAPAADETAGSGRKSRPSPRSYRTPVLVADPESTKLYVTWAGSATAKNAELKEADRTEIYFRASNDGGATWSDRVTVNDDAGKGRNRWLPGMALAPNGRVDIAWYDTRLSPVPATDPESERAPSATRQAVALLRNRPRHGRRRDHEEMVVADDGAVHLASAGEAMAAVDIEAALGHFSAAVRAFTAAGDCKQAALASASLGKIFSIYVLNKAAARVWFERAIRLLEHEPPCVEQGWVAIAAGGCDVEDPALLLARAELALDRARCFGDVDLECKALADAGLALVQAGHLARGMALLDEAMALACGPANQAESTGLSVCSFFTACYYAADFDRANSWTPDLRRHGLIGAGVGTQVFLASHCDAVQATLLGELGRWPDAEALLTRSIETFESRMGVPSWHPAIALAELRIRQGRLAEAEVLLLGKEWSMQALLPAARLHLARGDLDLARATATRGLRAIVDDRLRAAELVAVLVDVELAAVDVAAGETWCTELVALAGGLDVPGLAARTAAVRARVQAAAGDRAGAVTTLEGALALLPAAGTPFLGATLLIELARLHERIGNLAAARVEAARAAAAVATLDVVLAPGDTALLERLTAPAAVDRREAVPPAAVMAVDERGFALTHGNTRARLAATKGLRYLAQLVASPGVERHALDLVDMVEGVAAGPVAVDRRALGDAGEIADSGARAAYRHRLEALRNEVDEALAEGDDERAQALQNEADRLVRALAEAFGLGGRSRTASSAAEKARLNVTRALRSAVSRVGDVLPDAGAALDRRLRTGLYCAYEPAGDDIRWIVQSELNGPVAD